MKVQCHQCHGTGMVEVKPYYKLDKNGFGTPDSHYECDIITCGKCNLNRENNFTLTYGCRYWKKFPPE